MTLPPLAAESLFHLGPLAITNSMVNAFIALFIFVVFAVFLRFSIKDVPGRFQGSVEDLFEFLLGFFDQVTGDREKSKKFLPFIGTLFLFILVSNWMGLLPGTGSIGVWLMHEGHVELIPILRPAMSDLNMTVAIAILSVVVSHLVGIFSIGFFVHLNKFIQLGTLAKALRSLSPVKILTAIVEFIVGLIEIFSEIAKVVSLSLRLFGNIFAGEVLITVISGLVSFIVPLPFMALELIVGVVQATVFSLLALVYFSVASSQPHGSEDHEHEERTHAATVEAGAH